MAESLPPEPPPAKGWLPGAVALVGLLLLVTCVSARQLGDFDLPMHMATGRLIWQSGHVPRVDDFSYLHGCIRYIEIISVSLFYGAYRLGGPLGVQLLGGIAAAGIAVSLWMQTRRFGPVSLVSTALGLASAGTFLVVRSSALSFPLLALTLLVLDGHRRAVRARGANGPRIARRWLGAYVVLAFVWANVHGSVTLGLLLGLTYLGYGLACRLARGRAGALLPQGDGQGVLEVGVAFVLASAAASVNTGGPDVLLGPLRYGGHVQMLGAFSEWARPTWALLRDHEPLVPAMVALAMLAGVFGRDADSGERVPALFDVLLVLLAVACALTAVRLLPIAGILLAPWIARRAGRPGDRSRVTWLACAGSTLLVSARVLSAPLALGVGFDTSHLPEGAARWIEQHHPIDNVWNTPPFGGYLAWRLYPGVRILMDGRHGLAYDLADVSAVEASERDPAAWASLVRAHDVEWAVTRAFPGTAAGVPLAASADWTMVFLDDVAAVYVRGDGPNAALASRGYQVLRHLTSMDLALSLAVRGGPSAVALARDGALAAEQAPESARSTFFAACGAIAIRDGALFGAALERLKRLAPGDPAIHALLEAWDSAIRPG